MKLNGGSKGRRNGNIARDERSRVTRSVALYGSADPIFPHQRRINAVPLAPEVIAELRRQYPTLRDDYFNYLMSVGWGETEAGPMIYEGPTRPEEVYGQRDVLAGILLLGDDFQGYCFGYNSKTDCYGEVSASGSWNLGLQRQDSLATFLARARTPHNKRFNRSRGSHGS